MSSLLTKTEASSFHAFLDTMDYDAYVGKEWQMYAQQDDNPQHHDKSALTKATKDLMALDARGYGAQQHYQQPQYNTNYYNHPHHQQLPTNYNYEYQPGPVYSRQPTFPFLHQQRPPPPSPHPLNIGHHPPRPQYPTPTNSTPSTASTSSSAYSFPPDLPPSPVPHTQRRPSPKQQQQPQQQQQHPQVSQPAAAPPKRPRATAPPPPAKPALLSPSQKKANHIQSEQKRRANIRRGYESLCDIVPALREAIREEEALAAAREAPAASGTKGKRGRGRVREEGAADKPDGRAGPRSENVVLSKTIDYMNELISDREALRVRLQRARQALPPGHPALTPETPDPLWEREWKGGLRDDDGEDEDEDEEDSQ